jgi:chromate reductase, NAD(P)H dehydrogenase (quinone)
MDVIRVLGLAGSLRRGSFNRLALRAAGELLPEGMRLDTFDLAPIPIYDEDVKERGWPEPVAGLRARIRAADALLIATPEYNYSVSGVLKNAIDWASRPPDTPLSGKPVAMMGASPGWAGTVRAQLHLRQICSGLNMLVLNKPEVLIRQAADKFDGTGCLVDEATRDLIRKLLERLKDWTTLHRSGRGSG